MDEELVYLNGMLLHASEARLSPFDHGFLYGYGLFETMRAYSGKVFRLGQHIDRLKVSAGFLGLGEKIAGYDLTGAVNDTVKANHLTEARIRLTLSAGPGDIIPSPERCEKPTLFVVARPYTPLPAEAYERGYHAHICSLRRVASSPVAGLKTTSYLPNQLARRETKLAGADEGLLLNERGELAEGIISNIFIMSDGVLVTPSPDSGILRGVTRAAVLELASALNLQKAERHLMPGDLLGVEEAFITSSTMEIMPLTQVDGTAIGSGRPGALTRKLMEAYKELVRAETGLADI